MHTKEKFEIGNKVIKNPDKWKPNAFDEWGRGEGIGVVVEPPFELDQTEEVDVRWKGGRCFEFTEELLKYAE